MTRNEIIIHSCWLLLSFILVYSGWLIKELPGISTNTTVMMLGYSLLAAWLVIAAISDKLSFGKLLGLGLGSILISTLVVGYTMESIRGGCDGLCAGVMTQAFVIAGIAFLLFAIVARGIRKLVTK